MRILHLFDAALNFGNNAFYNGTLAVVFAQWNFAMELIQWILQFSCFLSVKFIHCIFQIQLDQTLPNMSLGSYHQTPVVKGRERSL